MPTGTNVLDDLKFVLEDMLTRDVIEILSVNKLSNNLYNIHLNYK